MADSTPAVLKVLVPRRDGGFDDHESTVLRLADGDGCPLLYRDDPARGGPVDRASRTFDVRTRAPLRAASPTPVRCGVDHLATRSRRVDLPTGADKAAWLSEFIAVTWSELDEPCERRTVDHAIECAERRLAAHDPERAVLVHGDVHQWNALQVGATRSFKLVDPDGLLAETEYDLGVILREDPDEPGAADTMATAHWMAARHGLDATAIWEWAVIERVSTGLGATKIGLQPAGRQMLALADRIALRAVRRAQ